MDIYGLVGAGGFGREVMPLLSESVKGVKGRCVFVIEDQFFDGNRSINRFDVITLSEFIGLSYDNRYFNVAITNSFHRERLSHYLVGCGVSPVSIESESHINLYGNEIGDGAIFCGYSQVTSNANIGSFFHCNLNSYVAHDCIIGDYVTFGPGVKCNGHVVVEDHAYIGAGAIIKDGTDKEIVIGKGAVVGMGAVVTKSVAPGETVVGNPARPIR